MHRRDELGAMARAFRDLLARLDVSKAQSAKLSVQLEAFIENSVDGFIVATESGTIEQVNPALLDLFGYEGDELIGRNLSVLMPDPAASMHRHYLQAFLDTGVKTYIGTIRDEEAKRKDGTVFPIALSISDRTSKKKIVLLLF